MSSIDPRAEFYKTHGFDFYEYLKQYAPRPVTPTSSNASPAPAAAPAVEVARNALITQQAVQKPDEFKFTFATEVKVLDPSTGEKKKVEVTMSNAEAAYTHYFYVSVRSDAIHAKGQIRLREEMNRQKQMVIDIAWMETDENKNVIGLGRALHELAIRYSFFKGYEGRVEFFADNESSGFHYKCGYRFKGKMHDSWPQYEKFGKEVVESYRDLCQSYRLRKASGDPVEALEREVASHPGYAEIEKAAAKELGRKPADISEALDYGLHIFWNADYLLDKYFIHPEQNLKSKYCNPENKKFRICDNMSLSDEERAKWKRIIESAKI